MFDLIKNFPTAAWMIGISLWICGPSALGESTTMPRKNIVIYGGTAAAVTAAIEAKSLGQTVVIVSPDKHLGGLSSGGLGWTDTGNKNVIGGLAREFYHRVYKHYENNSAWVQQTRLSYGNKGQGNPAIDGDQRTMWIFEPHVAEQIFDAWVKEHEIRVFRNERLDRKDGVVIDQGNLRAIKTLSGKEFSADVFIDATYEGDLMAAAGVDFHVGREAAAQYDEPFNGVQTGVLHHGHHFGVLPVGISPYVVPEDPTSGVLPRISTAPPGEYGSADDRVQAYCFRMCLTDVDSNRTPFPKPDGYDANQYELLRRVLAAGWRKGFEKFDPIPNRKTDTNNHGPFSTDNIGFNYDYPEASYQRREEIIREHETYQQGLMYYLANDSGVPEDVREQFSKWGLAKDEFTDNGNWPHQLYIREARRMIGKFVMTSNELLGLSPTPEPIGMGSYTIDSHNVQRYITDEGFVQNEGDIAVPTKGPYAISLGSVLPKREQVKNLVVPVCVSSSHLAYGSIRMEPVFMILGQSAGLIASMAVDQKSAVQDVPYERIKTRLLESGQVLEYEGPKSAGIAPESLRGIVVDDAQATLAGQWVKSTASASWIGESYLHDGNEKNAVSTVTFTPKLPASGLYQIAVSYPHNENRSSKVPVTVIHGKGSDTLYVDQKSSVGADHFVSLGTFYCDVEKPMAVVFSNGGTQGYVVVDAVCWVGVQE